MNDRAYNHVHDQRELGIYHHIPFPYIHVDNPYMGGYGPYYGMNYPYLHEGSAYDARLVKQTILFWPSKSMKHCFFLNYR